MWQAVALTPAQVARHDHWVAQEVYLNWLGPFFKAHHLRKGGAGGTRGLRTQELREPGRHGVLLFYHATIGPGNFRHLYELLGERLVGLGYHRACADRCTRHHAPHTETTLKQLFKPDPTDCSQTNLCNQRYGLVTVDFVLLNGEPAFIRLAVNPLLEHGFTSALSFESLAQALLDAPMPGAREQALISEYYAAF